ncbi:hypothetical protein QQG09_07905 [Melissococcus plutonius]|nr:hypothetical protein [Melissococcus plutonius]MCV2498966.1 hypothetical protein [Melissococcus plutonius]MCV2501727.1 hypothetical protein [Melissococcus plutonius]MCV2505414.1 hypothetical protein [Melissococcus plutonius]MCV2507759.1 hypothetical protein [Melissococcus plutonius]MCV2520143.1 hypothetical protein [Melissococcus plutonius]
MIIPKSSEWLVYRLLVGILPITQLDMAYVDWISYSIFGKIFNVYSFNLVIYTLIVLIGVPMIIKKYSKYEID